MTKKLLSLYGLKWNPFSPELPQEALLMTPKIESFCWRIEQTLVREGGFALVIGESGTGKSVAVRLLNERLSKVREATVGELEHPSSGIADFYREMGELFGVPLKPHNRWNGFKVLREKWQLHIDQALVRPVLLVDEAQEMDPAVLGELRFLSSTRFDSRIILTVVLAGDFRLTEMLRTADLVPLGTRIRARLTMDHASVEELLACLKYLVAAAGNAKLMTPELMTTICEHAAGNYRLMSNLAGELLDAAAQRERTQLDEKLYLEVFAAKAPPPRPAAAAKRR